MDYQRDLLDLHRHDPQRYPFLLQSVAHGTAQARYDILFALPQASLTLTAHGLERDGVPVSETDFLAALDRQWHTLKSAAPVSDLPFHGGWFLYLGYELVGQIEPRLAALPKPTDLPIARAVRIPAALIRDHLTHTTTLVIEPGFESLRAGIVDDITACEVSAAAGDAALCATTTEDDPQRHLDAVRRIQEYILAGDVFQVNLARGGACELAAPVTSGELFARLRRANPAPFAALALFDEGAIVSSSPERLVCVRDGVIQTRPIAGTRPRGNDPVADDAFVRELVAHPKERAEHIMLVDLERNDLGRVCVPGSVRVDELMTVESYAHVHHIVSNVRGDLRDAVTPGQVIRAVFPGGTITGCPKVRCMEIIAELERTPRSAYTGSVGYLNHDGSMDLNILIRTLVHVGRRVEWRAGGGIVADSVPQRELEETRAKARGLLRALGVAAP
jgi:anthranilate synthase component 1